MFFGLMLFFLAVSSFWMFEASTKGFRRNILVTVAGVVAAVTIVLAC